MKSLTWIEVMVIMSQASGTNGNPGVWMASYPKIISSNKGANVIIPCNVTHPRAKSNESIQAYWKRMGQTQLKITDKDKNEFIYHPDTTMVIKSFQRRTKLIGDIKKGNCSLEIANIENGDLGPFYLRISNGFNNYSFKDQRVQLNITGSTLSLPTESTFKVSTNPYPLVTTEESETPPSPPPITMLVVSIISGVVVLLVAVVGGVLFLIYRKRSRFITGQESGFYVNFTRTTPTPKTEKIETTKKQDDSQVPPPGVVGEPIYANVQRPNYAMESIDEINRVYANLK